MKSNYLLETEDSVLLENKIEEIIKKVNFVDAYKSIYDIEEVNLDNALEDLDTYSFLSDKKIIIIRNFLNDNNDKRLDHLLKYIDNPNPDNLLILTTKKLDNRLNISKLLKKNKNIEICSIEVDPYKYVSNLLKDYNVDNSSINLLIELCKNDITRLTSECNKLMLYKENEKVITKDDINSLVIRKLGDSNEILFSLIKYIISKNKSMALKTYKELKLYNVDVNSIIGLMTSQIKLTYQIKLLSDDNLNNNEIQNRLKLKSVYQVKKIKEYIYSYTYNEIYDFIHKLADIDYKIKSGRIDSSLAIDMLIINL